MSESDAPLSMIDEAAVTAAELRRDPYDYSYIESALPARLREEVLADAPQIPDRGSMAFPT
jgi:SM-20-related protein